MGYINPKGNTILSTIVLTVGVPQLVTPALLFFTCFVRSQLFKYNRILVFSKALSVITEFSLILGLYRAFMLRITNNGILFINILPLLGIVAFDLLLMTALLFKVSDPKIDKMDTNQLPDWTETPLEDD